MFPLFVCARAFLTSPLNMTGGSPLVNGAARPSSMGWSRTPFIQRGQRQNFVSPHHKLAILACDVVKRVRTCIHRPPTEPPLSGKESLVCSIMFHQQLVVCSLVFRKKERKITDDFSIAACISYVLLCTHIAYLQ